MKRAALALFLWWWVLLAAAFDQTHASHVMASSTSATAFTTLTTGFRVALTSTAPSGSSAGTELPNGSGYVTGGQTSTAPFASTATVATPSVVTIPHTAVLTWTNGSGLAWNIVGLNLNDGAGTPVRTMFGTWNGQPIGIAIGNTFQVALDAISTQDG